ncbi:MAG TPA: hypothetical protein VME67_03725 [Mycobacterium sp.]|nr:hypothetical protein [Mycobacterium sp.]HTX94012.1 hypothetical protein [Mycobacterium sp.]
MARSPEALKTIAELRRELKEAGESIGEELVFSAVEETLINQIGDLLDRKYDLMNAYADCSDVELQIKLSTEIRLLEGAAERLLRRVNTEPPVQSKPRSKVSQQAQRAAETRWARHRNAGA